MLGDYQEILIIKKLKNLNLKTKNNHLKNLQDKINFKKIYNQAKLVKEKMLKEVDKVDLLLNNNNNNSSNNKVD